MLLLARQVENVFLHAVLLAARGFGPEPFVGLEGDRGLGVVAGEHPQNLLRRGPLALLREQIRAEKRQLAHRRKTRGEFICSPESQLVFEQALPGM